MKKTGYAIRLSAKQFKGILLKHQSIAAHIQVCPQNLLKYSYLRWTGLSWSSVNVSTTVLVFSLGISLWSSHLCSSSFYTSVHAINSCSGSLFMYSSLVFPVDLVLHSRSTSLFWTELLMFVTNMSMMITASYMTTNNNLFSVIWLFRTEIILFYI